MKYHTMTRGKKNEPTVKEYSVIFHSLQLLLATLSKVHKGSCTLQILRTIQDC